MPNVARAMVDHVRQLSLLALPSLPVPDVPGLAYVAVGDDSHAALAEASHHVLRYYGQLWTEPANLIHHGPPTKIANEVAAYDGAVDVLIVCPQIPRLDQVEQLAEHVLPAYRTEAVAASRG